MTGRVDNRPAGRFQTFEYGFRLLAFVARARLGHWASRGEVVEEVVDDLFLVNGHARVLHGRREFGMPRTTRCDGRTGRSSWMVGP